MTLEEALIELGDQPLSSSPYSKTIRAVVNAALHNTGETVSLDSPGHGVLNAIYGIGDNNKQERILAKELGAIRGTDHYRQIVLGFSSVLAVLAILFASTVVFTDNPNGTGGTEIVLEIVRGMFDIIKLILGANVE